jgi:hypothetical protein
MRYFRKYSGDPAQRGRGVFKGVDGLVKAILAQHIWIRERESPSRM